MTVEEAIQAALVADAGVIALTTAARIKVPGNWQNLARPYIVHFPVAVTPTQLYGSLAACKEWDFYQVSCFGDTYSQAKQLAEAVKTLMGQANFSGVQTFWRGETHLPYEADVGVHQVALDFQIFEGL